MSYNEANLVAILFTSAIILLSYRDKPQNGFLIVLAIFVYAFFAGRLPL